jgi:hypothetical protein
MDLPRVKYSRGKTVPHSDLQVGTTLGGPRQTDNQLKILQWNAGGLNHTKKTELHRTLEDKEIEAFCIFEANVMEETIKYFHFNNYHLNFLPKS